MRYSFEKIDTVQACDVLLSRAQVKKQNLERKRRSLGEAIGIYRGRLDRFNQESAQVRTSLEVFTTACAALPAGKDKADIIYNNCRRPTQLRQAVKFGSHTGVDQK